MSHRHRLYRKVLLGLATSPLVLVPFTLGATLLAAALAFSRKPGMMLFAGFACLLSSAGAFFTKFLLGTEKLTKKALAELQQETLTRREQRMDELDQRLVADRDTRTEAALRDLRAFERTFRDEKTWSGLMNATARFDILAGVQDLLDGCVKSLETTAQLWETAQGLRTSSARRAILDRREEIIGDVQESIEQLSQILVGVQKLKDGADVDSQLARIRTELDENLAVAKKVQEKMLTWQREELDLE